MTDRTATDRGVAGLLRRALRSRASVLMPTADRAWRAFSLWTDVRLVRHLRGQSGFVLGTRPGINLMLARLAVPTLTTIGLEQMNLNAHSCDLQRKIKRLYPQLDALVVLTDSDIEADSAHLGAEAPRCIASLTPSVR